MYLALCLALLLGRHHDKPKVNLRIPRTALTKDVILIDCDVSREPPKCKSVKVTYIKGQEIIEMPNDRLKKLTMDGDVVECDGGEVINYCAEGFDYKRDEDGIGTCTKQ